MAIRPFYRRIVSKCTRPGIYRRKRVALSILPPDAYFNTALHVAKDAPSLRRDALVANSIAARPHGTQLYQSFSP